MSSSIKKIRKNIEEGSKLRPIETFTDKSLNQKLATANRLIGFIDDLIMGAYRKKINEQEFITLSNQLMKQCQRHITELKTFAQVAIAKENQDDFNAVIETLGKLSSKIKFFPNDYTKARELGAIEKMKKSMEAMLEVWDIDNQIQSVRESNRPEEDKDKSILAIIASSTEELENALEKALEVLNLAESRTDWVNQVLDSEANKNGLSRSYTVIDDLIDYYRHKLASPTISKDRIVELSSAISILEQIEIEDEEFYNIIDEINEKLINGNHQKASINVFEPTQDFEETVEEQQEKIEPDIKSIGAIICDNDRVIEKLIINRKESEHFTGFHSAYDIYRLNSLKRECKFKIALGCTTLAGTVVAATPVLTELSSLSQQTNAILGFIASYLTFKTCVSFYEAYKYYREMQQQKQDENQDDVKSHYIKRKIKRKNHK